MALEAEKRQSLGLHQNTRVQVLACVKPVRDIPGRLTWELELAGNLVVVVSLA
jgi:hypothetical protein